MLLKYYYQENTLKCKMTYYGAEWPLSLLGNVLFYCISITNTFNCKKYFNDEACQGGARYNYFYIAYSLVVSSKMLSYL